MTRWLRVNFPHVTLVFATVATVVAVGSSLLFVVSPEPDKGADVDPLAVVMIPFQHLVFSVEPWKFNVVVGSTGMIECDGLRDSKNLPVAEASKTAGSAPEKRNDPSNWSIFCTLDLKKIDGIETLVPEQYRSVIGLASTLQIPILDFRRIGDDMYVKSPLLVDLGFALPDGKSWIKIDIDLGDDPATDPKLIQDNARRLINGFATVDENGTEIVHKDVVKSYVATVDLNTVPPRIIEAFRDVRKLLELILSERKGPLETHFRFDFGVDDQEFLRRVALYQEYEKPTDSSADALSASIEIYDIGVELEVKTPPPEETASVKEMLAAGGPAILQSIIAQDAASKESAE